MSKPTSTDVPDLLVNFLAGEDFVLVPKDPTKAMVEAAELDAGGLLSVDDILDVYRAMLAAAPSPDSGELKP